MSAKAEKKPEKGLCFPTDEKGESIALNPIIILLWCSWAGERSTTVAGKKILAAAMRGAGTAKGEEYAALCEKEKKWRFKYQKHLMNMVKVSATR